ncbi:MAG: hypothetical protein ABIC57_00775 [bacterium]
MGIKLPSKVNVFNVLTFLAFIFWGTSFVIVVKPHVAEAAIPFLITQVERIERSSEGVTLEPIFLSEGGSMTGPTSSFYATKFGSGEGLYGELVTSDTRVIAMNYFLLDFGSPMAPYAETFVSVADEVGLDWRIVASIAGVESAFGRIIPSNSYNAWGWRGGPDGAYSIFESWPESVAFITRRIAVGYGVDIDPFGIESTYCPPCGATGLHSWAYGVSRYMESLEEYRTNL